MALTAWQYAEGLNFLANAHKPLKKNKLKKAARLSRLRVNGSVSLA